MKQHRIASLLPAVTDVLIELGLREYIVGISHECERVSEHARVLTRSSFAPETLAQGEIDRIVKADAEAMRSRREQLENDAEDQAAALSGIYTVLGGELARSSPSVLFTQSLCGVCAVNSEDVAAQVRARGLRESCDVVSVSPTTLQDVAGSFETIASACGCFGRGREMSEKFRDNISLVSAAVQTEDEARGGARHHHRRRRPRVLLLEWLDPPFLGGHWIPDMMEAAGCEPVLSQAGARSVETTWDVVAASDPDCILVACCGFDLRRNAEDAIRCFSGTSGGKMRDLRAVRDGRLFAVDGDLFSRPNHVLSAGTAVLARCAHAGDARITSRLDALLAGAVHASRESSGWQRIDLGVDERETECGEMSGKAESRAPSSRVGPFQSAAVRDIEENVWQRVHDEANSRNEVTYRDPGTGYSVFTEVGLARRKQCCGQACRHCPYFHAKVPIEERPGKIRRPSMLVDFDEHSSPPFRLLFSGGRYPHESSASSEGTVVLLAAFDVSTRDMESGGNLADAISEAKHLGLPLIGVPLVRGDSIYRKLAEAVDLIGSVWGDESVRSVNLENAHLDLRRCRNAGLLVDAVAEASSVAAGCSAQAKIRSRFCKDFRIDVGDNDDTSIPPVNVYDTAVR